MAAQKLIVFVKAPRPGTVKTRLAQAIGPESACAAYITLVEATLAQLTALTDVELRFSPDDAVSEIKPWLRASWRARPQGAGDLGARLHAAFTEAFGGGAERVTIIGSDCPKVTTRDIKASWAALGAHDLVLGPAKDGGYWLIALRGPQRALFEGIHWSTDRVLRETLDRAAAAQQRVQLLRELEDVDTEAQWRAFLSEVASPTTPAGAEGCVPASPSFGVSPSAESMQLKKKKTTGPIRWQWQDTPGAECGSS